MLLNGVGINRRKPMAEVTPEDFGYWGEVFGSPAFVERWRALRWGWEFCVFFPAVRIDGSMETAYVEHGEMCMKKRR